MATVFDPVKVYVHKDCGEKMRVIYLNNQEAVKLLCPRHGCIEYNILKEPT